MSRGKENIFVADLKHQVLSSMLYLRQAYSSRSLFLISIVGCLDRYNHDDIQGQSETFTSARQLEAGGDLYNWYYSRQLLGNDDGHFLLGGLPDGLFSGKFCVLIVKNTV